MRTFQHKVTLNDLGGIIVFAFGAFVCLWNRTNIVMVILGFILIAVTLRAVDRSTHTSYTLTDDGLLLVKTGRIGQARHVPLADVQSVGKRPFAFHLGHYVVIELRDGSVVSVQPENVESFLSALEKRLEKKESKA
ncbi:MAG: PH domain-containing protein [Prevotella sp.]|nr:PH domain-containing protein [Prevotella sp.]